MSQLNSLEKANEDNLSYLRWLQLPNRERSIKVLKGTDINEGNLAYLRWLQSPNRERSIKMLKGADIKVRWDVEEYPYMLDLAKCDMPCVDLDHCIKLAKEIQISDLRAVRKYNFNTDRWEEVEFNEDGDTIIEYMQSLEVKHDE